MSDDNLSFPDYFSNLSTSCHFKAFKLRHQDTLPSILYQHLIINKSIEWQKSQSNPHRIPPDASSIFIMAQRYSNSSPSRFLTRPKAVIQYAHLDHAAQCVKATLLFTRLCLWQLCHKSNLSCHVFLTALKLLTLLSE